MPVAVDQPRRKYLSGQINNLPRVKFVSLLSWQQGGNTVARNGQTVVFKHHSTGYNRHDPAWSEQKVRSCD